VVNKLLFNTLWLVCFSAAANAGEIIVSSGNSEDLGTHRSPYASALKIGQEDFNVVGVAIITGTIYDREDLPIAKRHIRPWSDYALVFHTDGSWSMGTTHRVDSVGGGDYTLPEGKSTRDIVGVAFSHHNKFNQVGFVYIWFSDGTACTGSFPSSPNRDEQYSPKFILSRSGTIHCGYDGAAGSPGSGGKYFAYTLAKGEPHENVVGVGIASNALVFAYYRDGTVSAGTSDDLDNKRPAYQYHLPDGLTPGDIIDVGIANDDHVYAFYRTNAKINPKHIENFEIIINRDAEDVQVRPSEMDAGSNMITADSASSSQSSSKGQSTKKQKQSVKRIIPGMVRPLDDTEAGTGPKDSAGQHVSSVPAATGPDANPGTEQAPPGTSGVADSTEFTIEVNTNRSGGDYRRVPLDGFDVDMCQAICAGEETCQAFSLVRSTSGGHAAICYLKKELTPPSRDACCTSGIKINPSDWWED